MGIQFPKTDHLNVNRNCLDFVLKREYYVRDIIYQPELVLSHLNMDLNHLGIQIAVVCATIVFLWLFIKSLKIVWKLLFIVLVFLALSFALPAIRQWIFSFF